MRSYRKALLPTTRANMTKIPSPNSFTQRCPIRELVHRRTRTHPESRTQPPIQNVGNRYRGGVTKTIVDCCGHPLQTVAWLHLHLHLRMRRALFRIPHQRGTSKIFKLDTQLDTRRRAKADCDRCDRNMGARLPCSRTVKNRSSECWPKLRATRCLDDHAPGTTTGPAARWAQVALVLHSRCTRRI